MSWGLDDLIQLDDSRMPDQFEDMDLTGNPLNISYINNLIFLEDFDGNFFTCSDMSG